MEVRAKATVLRKHATSYATEVAIVRGASKRLPAMMYMTGDDSINRYVQSGHLDVAHLVSGWRQDPIYAQGLYRSVYLDVLTRKPIWWTLPDDNWVRLDNYSADLTADREKWLSRCGGFCLRHAPRRHDLAYIQLDLAGLRCSCYEHVRADDPLHAASVVRPSDTDALLWLRTANRAAADDVHIYAAQRAPVERGEQLTWIPGADGAVLWEPLVDGNLDIKIQGGWQYSKQAPTLDRAECTRRCVQAHGGAIRAASFDRTLGVYDAERCYCFADVDLLSAENDHHWTRAAYTQREFLRIENCDGVRVIIILFKLASA